jgi:hypothetical protein
MNEALLENILPEINIECNTKRYHTKRSNYIPLVPTLFDERLVVACESDKLNLFC